MAKGWGGKRFLCNEAIFEHHLLRYPIRGPAVLVCSCDEVPAVLVDLATHGWSYRPTGAGSSHSHPVGLDREMKDLSYGKVII